ncbi:MAG: peptide deformylase, partial [Patescibacteria group bacterium]
MILPIITAPHPVLSSIAKRVEKIDAPLTRTIDDMKETLARTKDPVGVGLAAPQVGKSLQLFIVRENPKRPFSVFINPHITLIHADLKADSHRSNPRKSNQKSAKIKSASKKLEGCLSLNVIWGEVKRNSTVIATYLDEKGAQHTKTFTGFFAIVIQHEYDHLQGILFPRRVLEQKGKLYKS